MKNTTKRIFQVSFPFPPNNKQTLHFHLRPYTGIKEVDQDVGETVRKKHAGERTLREQKQRVELL